MEVNNNIPMPLILPLEDLQRLTGYKNAKQQREWLQNRGYPFEINGKGHPVVASLYVSQKLGFKTPNGSPSDKAAINWDRLKLI